MGEPRRAEPRMLLRWQARDDGDDVERWELLFGGVALGEVERDEDGSWSAAVSVPAGPSVWTSKIIEEGGLEAAVGLTLKQAMARVVEHVHAEMLAALGLAPTVLSGVLKVEVSGA